MTIVAPAGQYYDNLQTFGHFPGGPRGSAISATAGVAGKIAYRGAKWLARKFFKPNKYTYRGAVGRGIGIGTAIVGLMGDDDDLNGPQIQPPVRQIPNRFQQGNRRRGVFYRGCRSNYRYRHRKCC